MPKIYIIEKNADFIEGSGPMLFHSAYTKFEDAHNYVMDQEGIFGSEQGRSARYSPDRIPYNGFTIRTVDLRDSYTKTGAFEARTAQYAESERKQALAERNRLQKKIDELDSKIVQLS